MTMDCRLKSAQPSPAFPCQGPPRVVSWSWKVATPTMTTTRTLLTGLTQAWLKIRTTETLVWLLGMTRYVVHSVLLFIPLTRLQIASALPSKTISLTAAGKTKRCHVKSKKRKVKPSQGSPLSKRARADVPTAPNSPMRDPLASLSTGNAPSLTTLAPSVTLSAQYI